jgi:hypothetical protein
MKRTLARLSAISIERLTKRGRYADGVGLVLQVTEDGTRSWLFRWERAADGTRCDSHGLAR